MYFGIRARCELARVSPLYVLRNVVSKGLCTSSRSLAAQNLTMPTMSPTMTEGNITSWKVKEGDTFSAGDVLLEIETDKAQMDVEAQDDGKMFKISQQAGAKGIKIGTRIAVLAETDDDLSILSLPDEPKLSVLQDTSEPPESKASSKKEDAPSAKPDDLSPSFSAPTDTYAQKQTYPLYPSIAQLLREKGLPLSSADNIPASGPKGRLLKGDVLAYLGQINNSYSSEQSARIKKLGNLDLSNVKAVPAKEMTKPSPSKPALQPKIEETIDTEIAIPISLAAVISVQKRIQDTLDVTLPLSTFLARATELANEDLPRSNAAPTADELFNNVLGLHNVSSKGSRGNYIPQITALPSRTMSSERISSRRKVEETDVYDLLTGNPRISSPPRAIGLPPAGIMGGSKVGDSTNVFSVNAAKGEEKRVRTFLERVKTILQVEPGRLIL